MNMNLGAIELKDIDKPSITASSLLENSSSSSSKYG